MRGVGGRLAASAALATLCAGSLAARVEAAAGHWSTVESRRGGSTFELYVPRGAVQEAAAAGSEGAAAVVFLHEAGRPAVSYRAALADAADALELVLVLPNATTSLGWGYDGDSAAIDAAIARAGQLVPLDETKIALAGHGEGAGYAYLLAYLTERRVSALLLLGAPYLPLPSLFDAEVAPPVRMVFGDQDPAYWSDGGRLREQWSTLGVEWQLDVRQGFGHSTWPEEAVFEGFRFLAERSARPLDRRCRRGRSALCLGDGRFRAEVTFADLRARPGRGRAVTGGTPDSGLFWFFGSDNWEVMVKVLDACNLNQRFWVFAAAPTDLDYRLTVTDQVTGRAVQYQHEAGAPSRAVTDTDAFACTVE